MSICGEEGLATSLLGKPLGADLYDMLCNQSTGAIRNLDATLDVVVAIAALIIVVYIALKATRVVIQALRQG